MSNSQRVRARQHLCFIAIGALFWHHESTASQDYATDFVVVLTHDVDIT